MVAKKKKSRKPKKKSGDPITVGGGGNRRIHGRLLTKPVAIEFRDGSYPDPGGTKKFKTYASPFAAMKFLVVYINGTPFDLTSIVPNPLVGNCTVTIQAKGGPEKIVIESNKFRVTFHTGKYPPETGNKHESPDSANFIKSVSVDSPLGSFERKGLTAADAVRVIADIP